MAGLTTTTHVKGHMPYALFNMGCCEPWGVGVVVISTKKTVCVCLIRLMLITQQSALVQPTQLRLHATMV